MRKILLALLLCAATFAEAQVAKELDRLDTVLTKLDAAALPEDVKGVIPQTHQTIERARKAKGSEYALYRLRDAFIGVETLAFMARQSKSNQSVEAFEKLWNKSRARFEAKPPRARGTLLQRALIENAQTRAGRLYRASLPYAKASAPWSGVYYLGEAEGNLRFAEYVQSIAGDSKEKSPSFDRLAAALDTLERDTVSFFAGNVTNQGMIAVSVRLKEANEMLDAKRLDGAALLLVEARLAFSRRGGPRATLPADVPEASGSVRAVLESWAVEQYPPMQEKIRAEVVPFFASLLLPAPGGAAGFSPPKPASVTVTLVRWPYT